VEYRGRGVRAWNGINALDLKRRNKLAIKIFESLTIDRTFREMTNVTAQFVAQRASQPVVEGHKTSIPLSGDVTNHLPRISTADVTQIM
jgi:hypothetical protein